MASHYWGDEDFDWNALNHCVHLYDHVLKKYGRMCVYTKEKYGTMRLEYLGMGWDGIYGFLNPGHLIFRWKSVRISRTRIIGDMAFESKVDLLYVFNEVTANLARYTGISWLIQKYQMFLFNMLTLYCVKKYPHIKDEIMDEYEFNTFLYAWVKRATNYVCGWK